MMKESTPLTRMEELTLVLGKSILTVDETVLFLGLSKSQIYKLTSSKKIEHYKKGKLLYFKKSELENWMLSNKVKTMEEIEESASTFVHLSKVRANG